MRRRIIRKGDMFVLDKVFYAYKHYVDDLLKYGIIPLIFSRKKFKIKKALNSIQLTLDFFCDKTDRIKMKTRNLKVILSDFARNILNWGEFKPKRSLMEDVIKVMKKTFSLDKIHRYTLSPVRKQTSLSVVLLGIDISFGYREKKAITDARRVVSFGGG